MPYSPSSKLTSSPAGMQHEQLSHSPGMYVIELLARVHDTDTLQLRYAWLACTLQVSHSDVQQTPAASPYSQSAIGTFTATFVEKSMKGTVGTTASREIHISSSIHVIIPLARMTVCGRMSGNYAVAPFLPSGLFFSGFRADCVLAAIRKGRKWC